MIDNYTEFQKKIIKLKQLETLRFESTSLIHKLEAMDKDLELFWKNNKDDEFVEWVQNSNSPVLQGAEGHPSILDNNVIWDIRGK